MKAHYLSQSQSETAGFSSRPILATIVLLLGAVLALLNSTSANVAIPSIQDSIGLSPAGVTWSFAGWALTYALVLISAGKLGDRFGHKWLFTIGMIGFLATSVACALAVSELQFVLGRLAQGLTGGIYYPSIAALLSLLFTGRKQVRAFAVLGAVIATAAAIGPVLSGALLQAIPGDWGWRSVFLINVPFGVVAVLGAFAFLPSKRVGTGERGADLVGFGILTAGLTGILLALILGTDFGWPAWVWVALTAGVTLLVLFVLWELRQERHGRVTLVAPSLFRSLGFSLSTLVSFTQFAGFLCIFYLLSILWQSGLGKSALEVGFLTLPEALGSVLGAALVTRFTARWGLRAAIIVGSALLSGGLALCSLMLTVLGAAELTAAHLIVPLAVTGVGAGLGLSVITNYALATLPPQFAGVGSGVLATAQRTGNAVGLAVASSVLFTLLAWAVGPVGDAAEHYRFAASSALWVCTAITSAGLVLSLFLPREGSKRYSPVS